MHFETCSVAKWGGSYVSYQVSIEINSILFFCGGGEFFLRVHHDARCLKY